MDELYAAFSQLEQEQAEEQLAQSDSVILTDSFAAKAFLEKASWSMGREPEVFEQDGLRCAICHNLGQARRLLESGEEYDVLRVIA